MEKTKPMTKEQILKRIEELEKEGEAFLQNRGLSMAMGSGTEEDFKYMERLDSELASCQTALESFVNSIVE